MSEEFCRDAILECYRRASEARRIANAAATPAEKADFLEVERRWRSLAHDAVSPPKKKPQATSRHPFPHPKANEPMA
jgi:hypothetical protein